MNAYKGKGKANNPIQPESKAIGRILIADDDADTVLTYKSALEKAGYRVIAVDNGEDCAKAYMEEFQKLRISRAEDPINTSTHWNQPFEAVVLDYRMPQMNGMEVAKEILAVNPHQRIIFASAYIQETVKDSVKELKQVVELLQKPFSYRVLLDIISDKQIYNQLKKYNVDFFLKKAELSHEQLVEVLNILESSRKADQEEDEEAESKQDGKIG
jgi:CheY-like chemotaxis protein